MNDFAHDVTGISALGDDLRRELYLYVSGQQAPVSREQAARALDVPAHQAKFHLDRLEEAGLLESEYVRVSGRSGPGAGRPAKLYRRRSDEISVSLPAREYELAGELMAEAIEESAATGTPVAEALARVARSRGGDIGRHAAGPGSSSEIVSEVLSRYGYEPRVEDGRLVMANCPFHGLAATHTMLVCHMNLALLEGMCDELDGLSAALEPAPGRCCVVISGNGPLADSGQ
jgi:predicted ArsR family transcriptional regulator